MSPSVPYVPPLRNIIENEIIMGKEKLRDGPICRRCKLGQSEGEMFCKMKYCAFSSIHTEYCFYLCNNCEVEFRTWVNQ